MSSDPSNPGQAPSDRSRGKLTPEGVEVLAKCLVAGRSRKETAVALGASPRSVTRWKKDPRVLAEVERVSKSTWETRARWVLEDLAVHSMDERIRLQAAQTLLRCATQLRR